MGRGRAQADLRGLSRPEVVLARPSVPRPVGLTRFLESERLLALGLLTPAVTLLGAFVAYPFVVGVWLSLSDTRVAHAGHFVGLANFASAWQDSIFRTAFANTLFYTFWATLFKLALGMWLAVLLNRRFRGNRVVRAAVLLPFIVPTDRALDVRLALDVRSHLQRAELAPLPPARHREPSPVPLRRYLGPVVRHRGEHLARHAVLRDHAAGGAADHQPRAARHRSTAPTAGSASGA